RASLRDMPHSSPAYEANSTPGTPGKRHSSSGTKPMACRMSNWWASMSMPSTCPLPLSMVMRPNNVRISVVFPAPLGPSKPTAPMGTLSESCRKAVIRPYVFVTSCNAKSIRTLGKGQLGGKKVPICYSLRMGQALEKSAEENGHRCTQLNADRLSKSYLYYY